jgi:hypothetical protein
MARGNGCNHQHEQATPRSGPPDSDAVLYRPVGQAELDLIAASGWRRFPPRLSHQPIFYPVLSEEYATKIARDWNTVDPVSGFVGYVLRFAVRADVFERWPPQQGASGAVFRELWVPAEELDDFNAAIVGQIEVVAEYRGAGAEQSGGTDPDYAPMVPIVIERVEGGYIARLTPPHGKGQPWASEHPLSAHALVSELLSRGCHQTDIGDAFYAADPNWLGES